MRIFALTLVLVILGTVIACRDEASPERFNYNMGTAEYPLLPTLRPNLDASILNGRATVIPLAEALEPQAADSGIDDRAAIAELFERFRAAVKAVDYEAVVPLMVERQREVAKATVGNNAEIHHAVEELIKSFKDVAPQMYVQMGPMFEAMMDVQLDLDKLEFQSETEASAPLPIADAGNLGFEKSDGQWFIVDPDLADDPQTEIQKLTAVKTMLVNLTNILQDPSLTAQERATRIMGVMAGAAALAGDSGTPDDSSGDNDGA